MTVLMIIWYILSFLIGSILSFGSVILGVIGFIFIIGIPISIKEGLKDQLFFELGIIVCCIIFVSFTIGINVAIDKDKRIIYNEVPNIISYQGVGNETNGKVKSDYLYFKQAQEGEPNAYTILKLNMNQCTLHDSNDKNVKIILNEIEHTSPFKYLALFVILNDNDNKTYDVYLPK